MDKWIVLGLGTWKSNLCGILKISISIESSLLLEDDWVPSRSIILVIFWRSSSSAIIFSISVCVMVRRELGISIPESWESLVSSVFIRIFKVFWIKKQNTKNFFFDDFFLDDPPCSISPPSPLHAQCPTYVCRPARGITLLSLLN